MSASEKPVCRHDDADRSRGAGEPLGDHPAERDALLLGEPHERGHGVVEVALAVAEALRDRGAGALVEEVAAAGDDELRQPVAAGDRQALRPRRVDAVHQRVGELGERVVDDPGERARRGELLHRGAADAVGVEDHRRMAGREQALAQLHHARRGLPEHRHPDGALAEVADRAAAVARHADDRRGRVVEDRPGDRVQPEDVDHGVHHHRVGLAHERAELAPAGRARGHDQLRHADGERVHRARAHQAALGAAEAERAVEPALGEQAQADRPHAGEHPLDRGAARPGRTDALQVVTRRGGDVGVRDVGRDAARLAEDARCRSRSAARRARAGGRGRRRSRRSWCRACRSGRSRGRRRPWRAQVHGPEGVQAHWRRLLPGRATGACSALANLRIT